MLLQISHYKNLGISSSGMNIVTSNEDAILRLHYTTELDSDQTSKVVSGRISIYGVIRQKWAPLLPVVLEEYMLSCVQERITIAVHSKTLKCALMFR